MMMMMMRVRTTMGFSGVVNGCMADCRPYVTVCSAAGVCPLHGVTPGVHDDGCDDDVDDDGDRCHWSGQSADIVTLYTAQLVCGMFGLDSR